jgi:hypothetical protein
MSPEAQELIPQAQFPAVTPSSLAHEESPTEKSIQQEESTSPASL